MNYFKKEKRNWLNRIKRKSSENSLEKSVYELEVLQSHDHTTDVHQENIILKKLNKEVLSKMYALDSKLKELIEQNRQLWQEIYKKEKRQELFNNMMIKPYSNDIEPETIEKPSKREISIPEKSTSYDPYRNLKDQRKEPPSINGSFLHSEMSNEPTKPPLVNLGGFMPTKKAKLLP